MTASDSRNIVLTGFMGTGKTTVGRLLAQQLGYEFVDTDRVIEERHGKIADLFRSVGEEGFRRIERDLATELADRERLVISTGGRMMLDPHNVASLSRNGRVFCLVATPDEIFDRVVNDDVADRASAPIGTGSSTADRRAARRTQPRLSPLRAAHHRRGQRRRSRHGPRRAGDVRSRTALRSTIRAATTSTRSARRSCPSFVSWRESRARWWSSPTPRSAACTWRVVVTST